MCCDNMGVGLEPIFVDALFSHKAAIKSSNCTWHQVNCISPHEFREKKEFILYQNFVVIDTYHYATQRVKRHDTEVQVPYKKRNMFSSNILDSRILRCFEKPSKLGNYDGLRDLNEHIKHLDCWTNDFKHKKGLVQCDI